MNYTQLTDKKKVEVDILLEQGLSMREVARRLNISHSTISRYKSGYYRRRKIDINKKYETFIKFLLDHYDRKTSSIEICVHKFKKSYFAKCPSVKQVYNWINENKIFLSYEKMCYKRRKKRKSGMMEHFEWNLKHKTVLPISLRPKYIENRAEIGHLEIDSIIGKRNEYASIISIVDRCTRMIWLIKSEYKNEFYTDKIIYEYILRNEIPVKSITVDNGLEFKALGLTAKKLGVKLYKCDPYCSFQRGTNERMNGLVRRFLPKGISLKNVTQNDLERIAFEINFMPKKIFDYKSSFEIKSKYK